MNENKDIGYMARILDAEQTMKERMRISKSSLKKVAGAVGIYVLTMVILAFVL